VVEAVQAIVGTPSTIRHITPTSSVPTCLVIHQ